MGVEFKLVAALGCAPVAAGSTPPQRLIVAAGLVWLGPGRVLLQRRGANARHGAGRLEFPGGKVERTEAPAAALARELREEWGPRADQLSVGRIADVLHHVYPPPGPEVVLLVYHVDGQRWLGRWSERIVLEAGASAHAFDVAALPLDEFLEADREFATRIQRGQLTRPVLVEPAL